MTSTSASHAEKAPAGVLAHKRRKTLSFRMLQWINLVGRVVFVLSLTATWFILRRVLIPKAIFVVYGEEKHQRRYWPRWIAAILPPVIPVGFIRFGPEGNRQWGMIGASQTSMEQYRDNPRLALKTLRDARKQFPRALTFALAGQLPGWVKRALKSLGKEPVIPAPFVDGVTLGTVYSMTEAAKALAAKVGEDPSTQTIVVPGGAGYTGGQLVERLSRIFQEVVAYDPSFQGTEQVGNIKRTSEKILLSSGRLVLSLTAQGKDVADLINHLHPRAIYADDTHPDIPRPLQKRMRKIGMTLFKPIMVGETPSYMFPRLPTYKKSAIPGCLLEAMVVSRRVLERKSRVMTQEEFAAEVERDFHMELSAHAGL